MFIINFFLNMFRASLCPFQENKEPVTAFGVLFLKDHSGQRPTTATNHIQQNQNNTPNAVTGSLFS